MSHYRDDRDANASDTSMSEALVEIRAFLARQARQQAQAKAAEEDRQVKIAEARAQEAKDEAAKAAEPAYVMPNPLPTAPILERDG